MWATITQLLILLNSIVEIINKNIRRVSLSVGYNRGCRMLKGFISRVRRNMPYYGEFDNWGDNCFAIKIKPKEIWRRPLKKCIPYFTYKKLKLIIEITCKDGFDKNKWKHLRIYEIVPSRGEIRNKWVPDQNENRKKITFDFESTHILSQEQELELRFVYYDDTKNGVTIFSCKPISPDGIIIQILIGVAIALISGYIGYRLGLGL